MNNHLKRFINKQVIVYGFLSKQNTSMYRSRNILYCLDMPQEINFSSCFSGWKKCLILKPTSACFSQNASIKKVVPFNLSDIGEGIVEVKVKEWFVKPGDKVSQFDEICEVQSDKASVTITSRYDGVIKKLYYNIDDTANVGKPLIDIETELLADSPAPNSVKSNDYKSYVKVICTPAVRRIAAENKVDIQNIDGTGKDGRVTKEDILAYVEKVKTEVPSIKSEPSSNLRLTKDVSIDAEYVLSSYTKAMIKSMTESWKIPHFTYSDEVNVKNLHDLKADMVKLGQSKNVKITYMPFFVKAASIALQKYENINSHFDYKNEKLVVKSEHNIGIAIDTPIGLVVPVIKNVETLNIIEIAKELNRLQEKAVKNQLNLNDLSGGTFTLSNIGVIGGTYLKPVIVAPQVAIGALGKQQMLPRFDQSGNITKGYIINVSWSADHRILDGATVAKFSNLWKTYVEHPELLLQL